MIKTNEVKIIGAGLAGCEAAYQLAKRGIKVKLYETKTLFKNEIQKSDNFAELVCSNTLRSKSLKNAVGILKKEMEMLDSLILKAAYSSEIPGDDALAVDRERFSSYITSEMKNNPNIEIINEDVEYINDEEELTIVATGPLSSEKIKLEIKRLIGNQKHYFMDASAPIVLKDSINLSKVYFKSRHKKDNGDYMCIPLDETQFDSFYQELINAETVRLKEFENEVFFKGCQPIEQLAKKGRKNLLNGPLSPNNLDYNDQKPYAVIQLRQDDAIDSLYNFVGFQTNLKWTEQSRIIKSLIGFENAKIMRYGVMHKNYYINSPKILNYKLQVMRKKNIYFAGQITGVEGYIESAASGLWAGLSLFARINNIKLPQLSKRTILGSLIGYVTNDKLKKFNPMKSNLGIVERNKDLKGIDYPYYEESIHNMNVFINDNDKIK